MVARLACVLAALLAAGPAAAQADALESARAALRGFTGKTSLRGTLERAVTSERKGRPLEAGRVTLEVSAGPGGLAVEYPAALLEQVRAENEDPDPEKAKPVRRTLQDFDSIDMADLLNGAPALLSDLEGATLKSATATEYQGAPARLLDLDLVLRVSKADSKWVKSARRTMKLWTTPDGVPLAAESEGAYEVGLLFFTFEARDARQLGYARMGDRLVTLRRSMSFDGEGLGESTHTTSETTLRVRAGS